MRAYSEVELGSAPIGKCSANKMSFGLVAARRSHLLDSTLRLRLPLRDAAKSPKPSISSKKISRLVMVLRLHLSHKSDVDWRLLPGLRQPQWAAASTLFWEC